MRPAHSRCRPPLTLLAFVMVLTTACGGGHLIHAPQIAELRAHEGNPIPLPAYLLLDLRRMEIIGGSLVHTKEVLGPPDGVQLARQIIRDRIAETGLFPAVHIVSGPPPAGTEGVVLRVEVDILVTLPSFGITTFRPQAFVSATHLKPTGARQLLFGDARYETSGTMADNLFALHETVLLAWRSGGTAIGTLIANDLPRRIAGTAVGQRLAGAPAPEPGRGSAPPAASGDTQAPVITVNYPPANARVEHEEIVVTGVVVDDTEVASVETAVNGTPVRSGKPASGARGMSLRVLVPLKPGENVVEITARDAAGNIAQSVRTVTRTTPPTASASAPAPSVAAPPAPSSGPAGGFGNYHALVIGNQRYRTLRVLGTPVADATAVAETLRRDYSFTQVKMLLDASRTDILNAFDEMRRTLKEDDNLLIYYAGHGWLDKDTDRGYWLPIDAADDTRANWLSNADITDTLKALRARHVVIVADSCYSGTLTRSITVQRDGGDIARLAQKRSRTALTSGGLEPVADGGGGGHSVFARAFLHALRTNRGTVDLTTLFTAIRRQVLLDAEQTPEYTDIRNAGHDGGDFVFARPR